MILNKKSLYEIGKLYKTDKAEKHLFCVLYDYLLSDFREKEIKFLEIGILNGSSLNMWSEYFNNGLIYGCDINDHSNLNNDRIRTFILNQENEEDLKAIKGEFDIILDDGGHTMIQQQLTLKNTFINNLISKGIYIIEDLHTSEHPYKKSHGCDLHNNTIHLLQDLCVGKLRYNSNYFITEYDFYKLHKQIESIEIIKVKENSITSIIRKK